jgi:glucose-6-phosphate 1-dehydrogenase
MKTSVEWLQEQLECFGNKHELQVSWATVDELLEQAKEMEKEQIIDDYQQGYNNAYFNNPLSKEQYYQDTFKKD